MIALARSFWVQVGLVFLGLATLIAVLAVSVHACSEEKRRDDAVSASRRLLEWKRLAGYGGIQSWCPPKTVNEVTPCTIFHPNGPMRVDCTEDGCALGVITGEKKESDTVYVAPIIVPMR